MIIRVKSQCDTDTIVKMNTSLNKEIKKSLPTEGECSFEVSDDDASIEFAFEEENVIPSFIKKMLFAIIEFIYHILSAEELKEPNMDIFAVNTNINTQKCSKSEISITLKEVAINYRIKMNIGIIENKDGLNESYYSIDKVKVYNEIRWQQIKSMIICFPGLLILLIVCLMCIKKYTIFSIGVFLLLVFLCAFFIKHLKDMKSFMNDYLAVLEGWIKNN